MSNKNLNTAKQEKKDEFYTLYEDISKEMCHYPSQFLGKVVYCNCDNPEWSAFWQYFHENFTALGLKRLVATFYEPASPVYKMVYEGGNDADIAAGVKTPLTGNGDFRSEECIAVLDDETDIVVTNPPFSLFRDFINTLVNHHKSFLVIGNQNAITCKEIFPLFRDHILWYGASIHSGDRKFYVPDDYPLVAAGCGVDETGRRFVRVKGVRWFTNLDFPSRHKGVVLRESYSEEKYPVFDNYNAINVDKYSEIPEDYDGVMGVPITIMDFYNPEQFEIIGLSASWDETDRMKQLKRSNKYRDEPILNNKGKYKRVFIKKRQPGSHKPS